MSETTRLFGYVCASCVVAGIVVLSVITGVNPDLGDVDVTLR